MTNIDFKSWLVINEIGEGEITTQRGADLFADPAMEVALYVMYRQAYDPVSAKDHEEELHKLSGQHGISPEEVKAQGLHKSTGKAWAHSDWNPSGMGRTKKWLFTGVMPSQAELEEVRAVMGGGHADVQTITDQILAAGKPTFSGAGGVSWRDDEPGKVKMVGTWGMNKLGIMRAATDVITKANNEGKEIFTGADSALRATIEKAEKSLPAFHKKGLVAAPSLGLQTPPKEVMPILYDAITKHPSAKSGGTWKGLNPDTGAMKIDLQGSGEREKFIYGNKVMWKNAIGAALQKAGVDASKAGQLKSALQGGGMMAGMAASMANKQLAKIFPSAGNLSPEALMWLLTAGT